MKKLLLAGVCAASLFTSCLGPNNAHDGIRNWNVELSSSPWVSELVFFGLWIIPVYPLAYAGDVLIFNTMGFWGTNPINDPGPYPDGFHSDEND